MLLAEAVVDGRLEMFLANSLEAIDCGRRRIEDHLGAPDPRVLNRVEVVFEEIVANIVRHGFRPQSDQVLFVRVANNPAEIELVFEDEGEAFDPLARASRPAPSSLEEAEIGGLGLPLMRKMTSRARYERVAGNSSGRRVRNRAFVPVNRLTLAIAK